MIYASVEDYDEIPSITFSSSVTDGNVNDLIKSGTGTAQVEINQGSTGVKEVAEVSFNNLSAGQIIGFGGLVFTAGTNGATASQIAEAFASRADGFSANTTTVPGGILSGTLESWSTGADKTVGIKYQLAPNQFDQTYISVTAPVDFYNADVTGKFITNGSTEQKYSIQVSSKSIYLDGTTPIVSVPVTQRTAFIVRAVNDAPMITASDAVGAITEGVDLVASGSITFTDVDLTDSPEASNTEKSLVALKADGTSLALTSVQSDLIMAGFSIQQDALRINNGKVDWNYTLEESSIDFLAENETVTLIETITVDDGKEGGVASQEVSITIIGKNDIPVLNGEGDGISGKEDTDIYLDIQNFSELIDPDLTDQIYIQVESIRNGKLEQYDSEADDYIEANNSIAISRDMDGKLNLKGNLRFIPDAHFSGRAEINYRLSDIRSSSTLVGVIPIILAAQVDGIRANSMSMSLPSSLEISESSTLKVNAINNDPSELLIFKLDLTQGELTESFNYSIDNNEDGIFEIEMEKFAKSIGINNAFNYNEFINVSLSAKSIDEDDELDWSDPITAQVLAIPDMSRFIDLDPSSSNKDYRNLIFGANDFADAAKDDDFSFIAPDYEFVTSTNASFNNSRFNDDQLSESLKNITRLFIWWLR